MSASSAPVRPLQLQPRPEPRCCEAAVRFAAWTDKLVRDLTIGGKDPSPVALNRAELYLLRQFWRERNGSAPEHRDAVVGAGGAPCVYGVFLAAYERLQDVALRADPPPLTDPPPPPPRVVPEVLPLQAMGLLLGEG